MNSARVSASATLLPNGKVLITGGSGPMFPEPEAVLKSVELYDAATNSFVAGVSTPSMNQARTDATATLLNDGLVLIAGGAQGNESIVDLYDPATNSFAPAASTPRMNYARTLATATLLSNGQVLIAGGTGVFGPLNTTDLYTQ
jgi:large repetitive protein